MVKFSRALSGMLVAAALVAACSDPLTVANTNDPDRLRVFRQPSDVETLIKGTYKSIWNGTYGAEGLAPAGRTMSWENASNLNNWGMGPRSAVPRVFIDNNRGNNFLTENTTDWNRISQGLRAAGDGLYMLNNTVSLETIPLNARAKAFGWFSLGTAMGYLAMDYDSATILNPYDALTVIPPLSSYADVTVAALAALDSALAWTATAKTTSGGYAAGTMFDDTWINGATFTPDQFTRLIRTYKAYFRANVARDPTERAAVDWAKVRDDALNGITSTLFVTTGATYGWTGAGNQWYLYAQWHQGHQMILGMADSTSAYANWLALSEANKVQFLIRTLDRRLPSGDTRAAQVANSPTLPAGQLYWRNRATADPDAAPWSSYYDWYRMLAWYNASRVGPFPGFPKTMNDMLLAEAYIRLGQIGSAAALIDLTRVPNGLPALSGTWAASATATTAGPGGAACVPHVPQAPTYTSTACGNIMEMMKWEYRMETTLVTYISQFYSSRGWGDLPEGTPVHWPVPYQEMDTRQHPFYSLGGVGRAGGSVGKGNYGF